MRKAALAALGFTFALTSLKAAELAHDRQQQLKNLLKHDCGACHGLTLRGGLGPPLTPDALRETPMEVLRQTILHGRRGTPMPPFASLLSLDDVDWLITNLRAGGVNE